MPTNVPASFEQLTDFLVMDVTNSVSKGVFVFKNGATRTKGRKKVHPCNSFLDTSITGQLWFRNVKTLWQQTESMMQKLQTNSYAKILGDLLCFIEKSHESIAYKGVLPTAALLTGINQIDHLSQFEKLADNIRNNTNSMVVLLPSHDSSSLKQTVENIVGDIIQDYTKDSAAEDQFRKNQLNFNVLRAWYLCNFKERERKPNLIIILPDFELFNPSILQDLILILDSYMEWLPFVLIFGVATDVSTIHNVLPYHVTSRIKLCIFQSEPSIANLNIILNEVLLSPNCPFHMSGKVFKFLVDIFLFYDFSVHGFVQGFKYAFMEHYYNKSINALSCIAHVGDELETMINQLSSSELNEIRHLPSFRPFVESLQHPQEVIDFLTNDSHLRRSLPTMLRRVHNYWFTFYCALRVLHVLVADLPKAPLGKQLRELYFQCVSSDITQMPEFKECIHLLSFLSKEEMLQKIKLVLDVILDVVDQTDKICIDETHAYEMEQLVVISNGLVMLSEELMEAKHEQIFANIQQDQHQHPSPITGRHEFREILLTAAKQTKSESGVTRTIGRIMDYCVKKIFQHYLYPPNSQTLPLIELFVYDDSSSIRRHIVGVPRAAVHTALNNPQYYLQCECCVLDESSCLVPTLPDLSIAYKLHLESGRMINVFDWLQAFRTIIDDVSVEGEELHVNSQIQARFTRAVAELQFLGYIKSSKNKTDHVTRLTW